jgi:hypothetical protein
MASVNVYKRPGHRVKIEQTKVQRDWMDETWERHAYKCFPVSLANSIGWSISFLDDIEFIWDGISDTTPDHVQIIQSGPNVCHGNRANATISFNSELIFETEESMSIMSIVPPNYFIDGAIPFTSVMSTSFYPSGFPIAWKITRPNHKILIPAGTPVATLIPISLNGLSNFELNVYDKKYDPEEYKNDQEKIQIVKKMSEQGQYFTNFYRDGVDHKGNKVGNHELKTLKMTINNFSTRPENDII